MREIRYRRSVDDPELRLRMEEGQRECYGRFGASAAARPVPAAEHVHLFAAFDDAGRLRGGVRLHLRPPGGLLPLEESLLAWPEVIEAVGQAGEGAAELCGLWVGEGERRSALSAILCQSGMAMAPRLGARTVFCFAHQHHWFEGVIGLSSVPGLGALPYPDHRYRSRLWSGDPVALADVPLAARARIFALRQSFYTRGRAFWDPITCPVPGFARERGRGAVA